MDRRDFVKSSFLAAGGMAMAFASQVSEGKSGSKYFGFGPVLLRRVRLIDLESGKSDERESDIIIEKGRISKIAPAGEVPVAGMQIIEGKGRFALPGLIDCHAHTCGFFMTEMPGPSDLTWIPRQIGLNYRSHLRSGVTTVRDMMAPLRMILYIRSRAEDPRSGYPRMVCSGPMLTVANGYPPHVPPDLAWVRGLFGPLRIEVKDGNDAGEWVDRVAEAGVDWIKIGYSSVRYDSARTPLNTPSPELFRAIVDRAHHHNLPVAVHHTWLNDLRRLVELPFDTLEHLTGDAGIDPETLGKIEKRNLPVTTNLEVFAFLDEPEKHLAKIEQGIAPLMPKAEKCMTAVCKDIIAGKDIVAGNPPVPLFSLKVLRGMADREAVNLKLLSERGILIGSATDAGTHLMFGTLPDEICHMARSGMSIAAVLRSATSDAAKLLRINDIGLIQTGFRADLVLYRGDPLKEIEAIKSPDLVIRDGVLINA